MTQKKKQSSSPTRQNDQRDLVALGTKQPGIAEALAAYSQVARYATLQVPTPPRVTYAVGGNTKQES